MTAFYCRVVCRGRRHDKTDAGAGIASRRQPLMPTLTSTRQGVHGKRELQYIAACVEIFRLSFKPATLIAYIQPIYAARSPVYLYIIAKRRKVKPKANN